MQLHDKDFYLWTRDQADRLRKLAPSEGLDPDNLARAVESLGDREVHRITVLTGQILAHLIRLASYPTSDNRHFWAEEALTYLFSAQDSYWPSMGQLIDLQAVWAEARDVARVTLDAYAKDLMAPQECPFTLDDLLGKDLDPEDAARRIRHATGR